MASKGKGRRELIAPNGDKRYVRRDAQGRFTESDDVGRSLSQDRKRAAKRAATRGQGKSPAPAPSQIASAAAKAIQAAIAIRPRTGPPTLVCGSSRALARPARRPGAPRRPPRSTRACAATGRRGGVPRAAAAAPPTG